MVGVDGPLYSDDDPPGDQNGLRAGNGANGFRHQGGNLKKDSKKKIKRASPVHVVAQRLINRAEISITSLTIDKVVDDGLELHVDLKIRKIGPFRVRLKFPSPLSMSILSKNVDSRTKTKTDDHILVNLASISIGPGSSRVRIRGKARSASAGSLARFAKSFVEADLLQVRLVGDLDVGVFGIGLHDLVFSKVIDLKGLHNLDGLVSFGHQADNEEKKPSRAIRRMDIKAEQIDIVRGTKEGLQLSINTELPKLIEHELHLGPIDLTATYKAIVLGKLQVSDLALKPGVSKLDATLLWTNTTEDAVGLMSSIVSGGQLNLVLKSENDVSSCPWLAEALQDLEIVCCVASLQHTMVRSVDLVLASDFVETSAAEIALTLENHFGVVVGVKTAKVDITYKGQKFGVAELTPRHRQLGLVFDPRQKTISANDFELKFESKALVQVLRMAARDNGVNLGRDFEDLLALLDEDPQHTSSRTRRASDGRQEPLDIAKLVGDAIAVFEVELAMDITLVIGEFETRFEMKQSDVPVKLGSSVKHVIPFVARPIIEKIVSDLDLEIRNVKMNKSMPLSGRSLENQSINLAVDIAVGLTNFGPIEARLHVPYPAQITFDGQKAAMLQLDDFDARQGLHDEDHVLNGQLLMDADTQKILRALMQSETLDFRVEIPTLDVQAGGALFENIEGLKRTGTIKGLKGPRTKVESFSVVGDDEKTKRLLVELDLSFYNPSTLGLMLESMTLEILFAGQVVGEVTATKVELKPRQDGPLKMTGYVAGNRGNSTSNESFSKLVNSVASGHSVDLQASGKSLRFVDQSSTLSWIDEAFTELVVDVTIPAQPPIRVVACDGSKLHLRSLQGFNALIAKGTITLTVDVPYSILVEVYGISGEFTCFWNDLLILKFRLADAPVKYDQKQKQLQLSLDSCELTVEDLDTFGRFAACIVGSQDPTLSLHTTIRANIGLSTGRTAVNIPISFDMPLKGLNRMKSVDQIRLSKVMYDSSSAQELRLIVDVGMDTSNIISLDFSAEDTVSLAVSCCSRPVGRLYIHKGNFKIAHPYTILQGEFKISAPKPHENEIDGLISRFVTGKTSLLQISGDDDSSESPVLKKALKSLSAELELQPFVNCTMIESLQVSVGAGLFKWDKRAFATCVIRNYFDIPLFIKRLRVQVNHRYKLDESDEPQFDVGTEEGKEARSKAEIRPNILGYIDTKFEDPIMSIAPKKRDERPTSAQSSKMQVDLSISLIQLAKIFIAAKGLIKVSVDVAADIAIGDYTVEGLKYTQEGLNLDIVGLDTVIRVVNGIYDRMG